MVYRVLVFGTDVEFTRSRKEADVAFKESRGQVELWGVSADGTAVLLSKKIS
jgi:hypothetical protein